MGSHPINLALRFFLELAAYIAFGFWGWQQSQAWPIQIGLALGLPLVAATLWGTLAVPNDPSRSGAAPVPVPGWLRLGLELIFFALATWTLYDLGASLLSWIMGLVTVAHYVVSYDRLGWLIRQ